MLFMALSFAVMVVGAARENAHETHTSTPDFVSVPGVTTTPAGELADAEGKPFDAGRLLVETDEMRHHFIVGLSVRGVLAHYVVQEIFEKTAPPKWVDTVKALETRTAKAKPEQPVTLVVTAPTFEMPFTGVAASEHGVSWNAETQTLVFTKPADAETRTELAAAAPPKVLRGPILDLETQSKNARNTGLWLLLSYLFATLGELCLSPVGLSMVTKLAPRRFASLFMGVWLLTSSVAQYAGGSIGESWGKIAPITYFWLFVWTSLAGAALLAVLIRPLRRLMHEVH
jgi:POT family proton-dependent oligopeptide transporter